MPGDDPLSAAPSAPARITRALLLGAALVLGIGAVVYNEWSLGLLSSGEFRALTRERIHVTRVIFAAGAIGFLALSQLVRSLPWLRALAARPATPVVLLTALGLLGPLLLLDLGLRPLVEPKTRLFEPDPELGWRPRPGAVGEWGHVPVEINAKGLRGPEVDWEKPEGVFRVLYLGDSVTFGFGIERVEDTFPYRVGGSLERLLERPVETVNSGAGGWSPWQQHAYLLRDGLRYQPDLIVVGFVLNDVFEKFSLARFGGTGEGWHLSRIAGSQLDLWLSQSAIVSFLREGIAQFRFGADVFLGAQRYEAEEVRWLAENARAERLRGAWALTFQNLASIFEVAEARGIPAALLVFPYSFQLAEPATTGEPQVMLREFARTQDVPVLDLLPVLGAATRAAQPGEAVTIAELYLDPCHLSTAGHALVSGAIAEFLASLAPAPLRTDSPETTRSGSPETSRSGSG
jgi:lysophospholipase L1-like esterase